MVGAHSFKGSSPSHGSVLEFYRFWASGKAKILIMGISWQTQAVHLWLAKDAETGRQQKGRGKGRKGQDGIYPVPYFLQLATFELFSEDLCGYTYAPHVLTTAQQNCNLRNKSSVHELWGHISYQIHNNCLFICIASESPQSDQGW